MRLRVVLLLGIVLSCSGLLLAQVYLDNTGLETARSGAGVMAYESGDTLDYGAFSAGALGISGSPVFWGPVRIHAANFNRGPGYAPHFYGGDPEFNVPAATPHTGMAESLRSCAQGQGHYYSAVGSSYHAGFRGSFVRMWRWPTGGFEDSTQSWNVSITSSGTCIFVDAPLDIEGVVNGRVTIGSSHNIRITDNLLYANSEFPSGKPTSSDPHGNMLGVVSEADVKIANTPANGRENSGGLGWSQTNSNLRDVTVAASIKALGGSFTFENQNDPDSGYVCSCNPDIRGNLYLWGNFAQYRRGYFRRYFNTFTGYRAKLHFDCRLNSAPPPSFPDVTGDNGTTDSVLFGDVVVGTVARDTAVINTFCPQYLGAVSATSPFYAERIMPFNGVHFVVPVRFTPPRVGLFTGQLSVTTETEYFTIPIRGRGVNPAGADDPLILHPSSFGLSASPNPFNPVTTLQFELPTAGDVTLAIYDVLGRETAVLINSSLEPGAHTVSWDATQMMSGVYFTRLECASGVRVRKLLLMK